jgi:hypothetical protein
MALLLLLLGVVRGLLQIVGFRDVREVFSMASTHLVGSQLLQYAEKTYMTRVYRLPKKNGGFIHTAETVLDSGDNIVSDGSTPEEALAKQRQILPLALFSRDVLRRVTNGTPTKAYVGGTWERPR